jgi:hypothetical protein
LSNMNVENTVYLLILIISKGSDEFEVDNDMACPDIFEKWRFSRPPSRYWSPRGNVNSGAANFVNHRQTWQAGMRPSESLRIDLLVPTSRKRM